MTQARFECNDKKKYNLNKERTTNNCSFTNIRNKGVNTRNMLYANVVSRMKIVGNK